MERTSLLIVTGSMGAGKTSALGEASDILATQSIARAAIDLDAFGLAHLPSGESSDVVIAPRSSVCLQEPRFARRLAIPGGARSRRPRHIGVLLQGRFG
jgi:hypothetical protein